MCSVVVRQSRCGAQGLTLCKGGQLLPSQLPPPRTASSSVASSPAPPRREHSNPASWMAAASCACRQRAGGVRQSCYPTSTSGPCFYARSDAISQRLRAGRHLLGLVRIPLHASLSQRERDRRVAHARSRRQRVLHSAAAGGAGHAAHAEPAERGQEGGRGVHAACTRRWIPEAGIAAAARTWLAAASAAPRSPPPPVCWQVHSTRAHNIGGVMQVSGSRGAG